jgi:hypothetical protein
VVDERVALEAVALRAAASEAGDLHPASFSPGAAEGERVPVAATMAHAGRVDRVECFAQPVGRVAEGPRDGRTQGDEAAFDVVVAARLRRTFCAERAASVIPSGRTMSRRAVDRPRY